MSAPLDSIPEALRNTVVGCFECHGLNPDAHPDTFEHVGYRIHPVVSPADCRTCHPVEVDEYSRSKKANAYGNLAKNPVYHALVDSITGVKEVKDGELVAHPGSAVAYSQTCFACHGTKVEVVGTKTYDTDMDPITVPVLSNWPNQGVGRINPDGSRGSCTACHPRHSFSIEIARKPETCAQCHLEPDVPAWNVYRESKHGNIVLSSDGKGWDWDHVPWRVGKDFQAPTCAVCHNSLVTTSEGDVVAKRSHDFGARLWLRVFGLVYSHPQPKQGATDIIRNADGQPLPTTFGGVPAKEFLLTADEQAARRGVMEGVCRACHGRTWVTSYMDNVEKTAVEADRMVMAATEVLKQGWSAGIADPANPFDDELEHMWIRQWLFYANSVRYAAAMGGPDYAAFKNGWWELSENLRRMHETVARAKASADK